jgi:hypothetical protein
MRVLDWAGRAGGRAASGRRRLLSCLLAVSVQAIDGGDTAVELAANAQMSSEKYTHRSGGCLQLPLASRVRLQGLALQKSV